jgi:hypothetical protein
MWMTRRQTKTNKDVFKIRMMTLGFSETCHSTGTGGTLDDQADKTKFGKLTEMQALVLQMTNQTNTKKDNFSDLGPSVANSVDDEPDKDKEGQLV